jgi:hypothetical protein
MILDKFREIPKSQTLFLMAITGFLLSIFLYVFVFMPIEAGVSTYGIIDYEFAWTASKVETIFEAWDNQDVRSQKIAIYWDFLFIVGYVLLAFSLVVLVLQKSEKKIQTIGTYIVLTPFLTGIFDIIENINLLIMSPRFITIFNAFMASLSATLKFTLLFIAITYFIVALIFLVLNKVKNRN